MNEQEYMKITGKIDKRFVNEYQQFKATRVVSIRKRIVTGVLAAAVAALLIPAGVFAAKQLIHHDKVSILYGEEAAKMIEENIKESDYVVENDYFRLTVDCQICDGNFTQGIWTLTALNDEAKEHLEDVEPRCIDMVTGERIGGGGSSAGDAIGEDEISWGFTYKVPSHPARVEFIEWVKTGEYHCYYGYTVVEDKTYFEGLYFDLLREPNVPTKILRSEEGQEITLTPYGLSYIDETLDEQGYWPIGSLIYLTTDGQRVNIFTDLPNGRVTTDLEDVNISWHGEFGSREFCMQIGTAFNVDNISGVEINGVPYMAE